MICQLKKIIKSLYRFFFLKRTEKIQNTKYKIYQPASISSDVCIGDYSYIASSSHISMTTIGKFCSIGPSFLCGWGIHPLNGISTHPMFYSTRKQNGMTMSSIDKCTERKQITIGNDVFIGANVTILDGVSVGDGCVIGAGAVVTKDVPDYAIVGGVPEKLIRYRFSKEQIAALHNQFLQRQFCLLSFLNSFYQFTANSYPPSKYALPHDMAGGGLFLHRTLCVAIFSGTKVFRAFF